MIQKINRLLAILMITLIISSNGANVVYASPEAPSAPSAPTAPEAPSAPSAPTSPEAPKSNEEPKPEEPKKDEHKKEDKKDKKSDNSSSAPANESTNTPTTSPNPSTAPNEPTTQTTSPAATGNQTGGQTSTGNSGDSTIKTGDATNTAGINSNLNSNLNSGAGVAPGSDQSSGIVNSGNGANSTNNGSATVTNTTTNNQNNSAQLLNNLNQSTTTGDNSSSKNTNGDSSIITGDANTTGTVISNLNTNVSGVAVAEFNVADNHVGDITLNFATGCISNCGGSTTASVINSGNGAESTNSADLTEINNNESFQNNDADVENNLVLGANSGNNTASKNTGGNSNITTGDANVSANVLTFANNNISGNVIYTVVNIFGDLIGDIIMPEEYLNAGGTGCSSCGTKNLAAGNTGNGSDSTNETDVTLSDSNNTFQSNDANIENNLILDANTANNSASENTDGDNKILTGDTSVDANVLNIANSNVSGDNWWLVIVNEAGKWVGKIVGSPNGATMAGSSGTEFIVDENGQVIATNNANGSGSDNTASLNQQNNTTTTQTNTANIVNNVDLSANTGNNNTNKNTGGDSSIKTGDANIVANIVNFVNNNITGGGKLFVTVINVFGSWQGNFVGPGQQKETTAPVLADNSNQDEETDVVENAQGSTNTPSEKKTKKKTTKYITVTTTPKPVAPKNTLAKAAVGAAGTVANVAGIKIGPTGESLDNALVNGKTVSTKGKIKVNLAWLIIILPLALLVILSRVKIAMLSREIKKRLLAVKNPGVILGSIIAMSLFIIDKYQH